MQRSPRSSRLALCLGLGVLLALGAAALSVAGPDGEAPLDQATLTHVLNRLTFGARPEDIARVKEVGLKAWIEAQLAPATTPDDALEARLKPLQTLAMSTAELRQAYEVPVELRREIQKARAEMGENGEGPPPDPSARPGDDSPENAKARRAEREALLKRFPELARLQGRPVQVVYELQAAKLLRATFAERQLEEMMVDFWFNHFNVFARKGPIEYMVREYEDTLREHALGRFEDLLVATARSPAMLFYLDNWRSTDPNFSPRQNGKRRRGAEGDMGPGSRGRRRPGSPEEMNRGAEVKAPAPRQRTFGINENYARELMELHTLGVDGGYTQEDVIQVARAFTGWTIRGEGPGGPRKSQETGYSFEAARHVKGDKMVLGAVVKNGGEKEGLEILHRLATHPSTARFIATKLVRRFVSDNPPPALVSRAATVFEKTDGDLRQVLRTILLSEEFLGPSFRSAKIKTPFEFVVSSLRVTGADVVNPRDLAKRVGDMGMPLYLEQAPTGYKDTSEEWISTSSLLERMNFALDLSSGRVRGVRPGASVADPKGDPSLETIVARVLPEGLSASSKTTLEGEAEKPGITTARLTGLVLGSPEFQKR